MDKQNTQRWRLSLLTSIATIILLGAFASVLAQGTSSGYDSPAQQQIRRDMIRNAIRHQAGGGHRTGAHHSSRHSRRRHRR